LAKKFWNFVANAETKRSVFTTGCRVVLAYTTFFQFKADAPKAAAE